MSLIGLLVLLIVVGLCFWVVRQLGGAFQIPAPIITVIYVVLVIFVVLYLLSALGLVSGGPVIRLN